MGAADTIPARLEGRPSAAKAWLRALEMTAAVAKRPTRTLPVVIEELAQSRAAAPALLSESETLTYGSLAERANRYARWALGRGIGRGDRVCLIMPNRPEYMAIWLGITRVGGVVALINTNLSGASLAHAIDIVAPAHVIVAAELADVLVAARPHLAHNAPIWSHGAADLPRIDREVERHAGDALAAGEAPTPTIEDPALLIYTSGTTGLPKAAKVSHHRLLVWSHWFAGMMDTRPDDRMYNCLPMYHSIGGVAAAGALLVGGGSVLVREKFSARQFFDEIRRFDCTMLQYIGELCRYLVNSPPWPGEAEHRIRLACGNGLRPDVWEVFRRRFAIPQILEFYASTEGNVTLFNYEERPGAIGRVPPFLAHRRPALVRHDAETGAPARGADGFCVRCAVDEVGEAIGRISRDPSEPGARFEGYTSSDDTERKILRDVFTPGDAWFRTGDLMRIDPQGYFHFVDRVGDTFRWKGENVATLEVSEAITAFPGIADASVYGVAIPGHDGRAGMAALVAADLDLAALRGHLADRLPAYARPLFVRIRREIEVTATFKHKKTDLVREGYDPAATTDAVYFADPQSETYVRLDRALHDRINAGEIKL